MVRNRFLSAGAITAALALTLAGCGPSPLYVASDQHRGTGGDIPRDGTGEPIFNDIVAPQVPPPPPYVAPAPGVPVTGPGAAGLVIASPPTGPAFVIAPRDEKQIRKDEKRRRRECRHQRSCK